VKSNSDSDECTYYVPYGNSTLLTPPMKFGHIQRITISLYNTLIRPCGFVSQVTGSRRRTM